MRVVIDADKCVLHGECVAVAHDVFDINDDDDTAVVTNPEPGEGRRAAVEQAVAMCPVAAIRIEE